MAVAFVALLAALSGTAVALPGTNTVDSGDIKNNTVRSRDLRNNDVRTQDIRNGTVRGSDVSNNSLTGDDIVESSLGTVPSATSANTANTANTATNANSLGGVGASSYATKAGNEAVHVVGAAGEPAFGTGWANVGGPFQTAGFYKDQFGIVHLRGDVTRTSGTGTTIFILPVGYRPTALENFAAYGNNGTAAGVAVRQSDGAVVYVAGDTGFIGLGGMSFRAG